MTIKLTWLSPFSLYGKVTNWQVFTGGFLQDTIYSNSKMGKITGLLPLQDMWGQADVSSASRNNVFSHVSCQVSSPISPTLVFGLWHYSLLHQMLGLICLWDKTVIHYIITQGNSSPIMSAAGRSAGKERKKSRSISACRDWQHILAETDSFIFLSFIGSRFWLWCYWSCKPSWEK